MWWLPEFQWLLKRDEPRLRVICTRCLECFHDATVARAAVVTMARYESACHAGFELAAMPSGWQTEEAHNKLAMSAGQSPTRTHVMIASKPLIRCKPRQLIAEAR